MTPNDLSRSMLRACAVAALALSAAVAQAGPVFRVTELGTWWPASLNDAGVVGGVSADYTTAILWQAGVITHPADLGTVRGVNASGNYVVNYFESTEMVVGGVSTPVDAIDGDFVWGQAINDSNWVVGGAQANGGTQTHAFIRRGPHKRTLDLGTLGGANSFARGINAKGAVVGDSDTAGNGGRHAFLYRGGVMTDLGALVPGGQSAGTAINGADSTVGSSTYQADTSVRHAFLRRSGVMKDLGTLPGGTNSAATGINDLGHVVGTSNCGTCGGLHGFFYDGRHMNDINDLLETPRPADPVVYVLAINGSDQVVGWTKQGTAVLLTRLQ